MENDYRPSTYRRRNDPLRRESNLLTHEGIPAFLLGSIAMIGNVGDDWTAERDRLGMSDETFAAFLLKMTSMSIAGSTNPEEMNERDKDIQQFTERYQTRKDRRPSNEMPSESYLVRLGKFANLWEDRRQALAMTDEQFASFLLHLWKYISNITEDFTPVESVQKKTKANMAFVTVATDDNYALGALVLGYSLRDVNTEHKLVILITPEVSDNIRRKLRKVFDEVRDITVLDSHDEINLSLMGRPELGKTFTKLHIWKLTEYEKCVFLDADTLVLKNCDELFLRDELSAVPDVGWPDCFNSGVFVFVPNQETYRQLIKMASEVGSFDGGDQGLLNTYFGDWATKDIANHLSFIYNMVVNATYTYLPAYKQYGHNVKIVHFLGSMKPWMHQHSTEDKDFQPCDKCRDSAHHLRIWMDIYFKHVVNDSEEVQSAEMEICEKMVEMCVNPPVPSAPAGDSNESRKTSWELGQIDYLGVDSFENIQRKLEEAINKPK